ncbi:MAG: hypothetical protein IJZ36_04000, partial [Bacilli bacterium]|nr:hypothetical protein [Bacilli bacterium]
MKKLIGFFLVCLCISLYSGATVYADENDGTEELVKYGEDWQKLMDLPVKLPEDGTMLFFNNSIFKWDVNTETYVIDEEGIKTKLTDKNDYDIFTFGLTDSTLWGICVGESYAYLYTEGADNYGSVEVLTDDFDECMMYCEPFKVEPCAHPDLLMLRLGDSFISSYNETYVLIFSGTTIDDCIYKIPITDVWRYMKGKKVESYIKDISIIAEDIIDGDLVIGKNIKLRWNAVGYPNT